MTSHISLNLNANDNRELLMAVINRHEESVPSLPLPEVEEITFEEALASLYVEVV